MPRPRPTQPSRLRSALSTLVVCALLALPTAASASVFDIFGMTARGTALGGAMGAAAADHAAIYYNPAGMSRRKKTHVGVTAQVVAPALSITQSEGSTRNPVVPETNLGVTIGAVFPLGGKIDDRVAIGVALFLPVIQFTRYEAIDPATPQFYLYQSLPDALVLAAGVAVEVVEWLHLGVGTQILASFEGELEIATSIGDRRVVQRSLAGDVFGEVAPTAGIFVGPFFGVSLGVTYRDDLSLDFELPLQVEVAELGLLDIDASGRGLYTPDQVNVGLAWADEALGLLVAADVTWMRWSAAPSPALEIEANLDDAGLQEGEAPETLLELETLDPPLGAKDVVVPHIGAEYRVSDLLALQAGYFYRASPIPDQVGYTNYIDNAAHVASLGASLTWDDPLEVHEEPVSIDLFVQTTILQSRSVTKDPARDIEEIGGWEASGMVWNFGAEWRHDL